MTDQNQNNPSDLTLMQLDESGILQSAFDCSKVDGRMVDVDELIQNARKDTNFTVEKNSFIASRYVAIAVGVCTFLAVCLAPFLLGENQENSALAWQDFKLRVSNVQSIEYEEVESFPGSTQRTEYRRTMILGRHRQRIETFGRGPSKTFLGQLGDAFNEHAGFETDSDGPKSISISDLRTGNLVSLDLDQKTYTLLTHYVVTDGKGKELSKTKIKDQPEVDFYSRIKTIPADATTALGKKQIDGRDTIGFGVKKKWGLSERSETYWIDAETRLPVKIEISITPGGPKDRSGAQTWTLTEFQFDQPLDEKLFSTDPPIGFTVTESSIHQSAP